MKFSKKVALTLAAALAIPAAAFAQDLTVGATVYGPNGGEVGTIESVAGGNAVVNTGTNTAALPGASFTAGEKGLTIGFTKEQLDAAIEAANQQAADALNAALVAGAALRSQDGVELGTVSAVEGDNVTVELESGPATFTRDQFATDANGLIVRLTADQIAQSLAAAGVETQTSAE
ncbi:MAG: hypothetical protein KDE63_02800 [Novosphingobium sp.]|nr:hypothetical protein [Novosphingobium sp.]